MLPQLSCNPTPTPCVGNVAYVAPLAPAPVLTVTVGGSPFTITWTYGGTTPDHWVVQYAANPAAFADGNFTTAAGVLTFSNAFVNKYWRVYGADAGGVNLTGVSNTVFP